MKKCFFCLIVIFGMRGAQGQVFLIDKTSRRFIINEKILTAKEKHCYVVNCISKDDSLFQATEGLTPFIFIKVFSESSMKHQLKEKPANCFSLEEFILKTALPVLKTDMLMNVVNMAPALNRNVVNVYDSIVVFDGKNYSLLEGLVEVSSYNLLDFEQLHIQQSSVTIINTKAKVAPVFKSTYNGLDYVDYDKVDQQAIFPKLNLIKKDGDRFKFSLLVIDHNSHDAFDYHRDFIYKKGHGIVEFTGKWLFFMKWME
jgi:hypothetical protein